jgi:hypothetical protein
LQELQKKNQELEEQEKSTMIRMSRDDADETARRICSCREDRQAAGLQSAQKHILLSDLRSTRTQNEGLSPAHNAAKILYFLNTSIDHQCFCI